MSTNEDILKELKGISERIGRLNFADTAYPVWTDTVDYPNQLPLAGRPAAGAPGEPRADSARGTIGAVLGWRLNPADPAGFVAALNRAFRLVEDDQGNTVARWVPPTYSVQSLEVGLGAVTGAQASLLAQARVGVEQVRPLIEALTALGPDSDQEDVEAIRGLVLAELDELLNQLGTEGGPVPQRVDSGFELLLGTGITNTGPNGDQIKPYDVETGGGQLGLLRDRLGLESSRVNTIDEEERLTNFLIIVGNIDTMRVTWLTQRKNFRGADAGAFLGTQLVLLTRALLVVAESVQEVYFALDSVFVGPSERQVLRLPTDPPITASELLSWVEEVASKKGIDLIRNSGKDGIIHAFAPIVAKLSALVRGVETHLVNPGQNPPLPPGLYTQRVVVAWQGLAAHLASIEELMRAVRRTQPRIVRVSPKVGFTTETSKGLAIDGEDFDEGVRVLLTTLKGDALRGKGFDNIKESERIVGTDPVLVSDRQMDADFDLSKISIPAGEKKLSLTALVANPDGSVAFLENAFTVHPPPAAEPPKNDPPKDEPPKVEPPKPVLAGIRKLRAIDPKTGKEVTENLKDNIDKAKQYARGMEYDVEVVGKHFKHKGEDRHLICDFGKGVNVPTNTPSITTKGNEDFFTVRIAVLSNASVNERLVHVFDSKRPLSLSEAKGGLFIIV